MRNATIVVMRLKGVATETIKNIVLAGIGRLIIVDDGAVTEEDLGAGFFFRDEDVGRKVFNTRVDRGLQRRMCGDSSVCSRSASTRPKPG